MTMTDEQIINTSLDRCEEILQILDDTFSDTPEEKRFKYAFDKYNRLTSDGRTSSYKVAVTYLEWCLTHPRRIGGLPMVVECMCEYGWVLEQSEPELWRPCPKCLPGAHDKWIGHDTSEDDDLFDGSAI